MPVVRAYGEFWSLADVNWGGVGAGNIASLDGYFVRRGARVAVNAWQQQGIYMLFHEFDLVYVGKATDQALGQRLNQHRNRGRLRGRWDSFSWYGLRPYGVSGNLGALPRRLNLPTSDVISALEALTFRASPPNSRLNRSEPQLVAARKIEQRRARAARPTSAQLQEIEGKLDQLLQR